MEYKRILYEKKDRIATVTLTRPASRNAWSEQVHMELEDIFPKMAADPDVLVTILTGDQRGKAFSAGADVANPKTHSVVNVGEFLASMKAERLFDIIQEYPKPIVCAINGYALGIGCLITLCCDILIASENAEIGLPQVGLGILPAYGGAVRLARFVGKGNAMRIVLTSERITAQEAYRIGLVTEVVPLPKLIPTAEKIAKRLASLPPLSVKLAKESMNRGLDIPNLKDAAVADLYRFLALMLTEDRNEGHSAWREKRQPVFKGK